MSKATEVGKKKKTDLEKAINIKGLVKQNAN